MAKPIAILYLNTGFTVTGSRNGASTLMEILNEKWVDYYWLSFYKDDIDAPELKVFHEKDFTDIQYEELKQLVLDSINKANESDHK